MTSLLVRLLLGLQQIAIPPATGYVNDFAGVLDPSAVQHMEALIAEVRDKTRGDIAVVTLGDIGDRSAADVALQIGRQWGVGAKGAAGDPAKNLGVVILLVPRKNHRAGTGQVFISTGRGAEGFLPDSRVGRIRDAMGPYLAREEYGAALELGVDAVAQAFAEGLGVTLTGSRPPPEQAEPAPSRVPVAYIVALVLLLLLTRGRLLWLPFWLGGFGGQRSGRGGWSSGWGGGGGGFSGGFGGFGGGGGFSGGGAGGRF